MQIWSSSSILLSLFVCNVVLIEAAPLKEGEVTGEKVAPAQTKASETPTSAVASSDDSSDLDNIGKADDYLDDDELFEPEKLAEEEEVKPVKSHHHHIHVHSKQDANRTTTTTRRPCDKEKSEKPAEKKVKEEGAGESRRTGLEEALSTLPPSSRPSPESLANEPDPEISAGSRKQEEKKVADAAANEDEVEDDGDEEVEEDAGGTDETVDEKSPKGQPTTTSKPQQPQQSTAASASISTSTTTAQPTVKQTGSRPEELEDSMDLDED